MNTTLFLRQAIEPPDSELESLAILAVQSVNSQLDHQDRCDLSDCWRYLKSPVQWGFFVKSLIGVEIFSRRTKTRACHMLFDLCNILDVDQEPPPWLFRAMSWLAENGKLRKQDILGFRKALIRAVRYSETYLERADDIQTALAAILWYGDLTQTEKADVIITALLAREVIGNQGRYVFDALMNESAYANVKEAVCRPIVEKPIPFDRSHYDFPFETTSSEKDLLTVRFTPGNIRRTAVIWMVRLQEEPVDTLKKTIKSSVARGFGGDAVLAGSIDVLDESWEKIDEKSREKLLRKAITMPDTGIRKRAYLVGERRIGREFMERTLKDKAQSIRDWGSSRLNS